ncbi:hypothetical protein [Streptomyces sp. NPDC093099]|uniref:hypothetical protein n=1 Tax=Streptomyces sp. NPDC093099 TaxID=3366028 RepID=UPI00381AC504
MTSPPAARIHLMTTFFLVTCGALGGACFGLLLGGRGTAVVAAGAAGPRAGTGAFLSRRQVRHSSSPGSCRSTKYAEGIADAVLVNIATYQAAAFPLPPGGLTEEERDARRTPAYRVAAVDGLPPAVRGSAADALDAVDQGRDTDHAQAAMDALFLTVYEHRRIR